MEYYYSIKLISNSGKKINTNQMAALCTKHNLPIEFVVDMLEYKYSKVWFKQSIEKDDQTISVIAYQILDGEIKDYASNLSFTAIETARLKSYTPMEIPKADVAPDEHFLIQFNQFNELKKYNTVSTVFEMKDLKILEPKINWDKVIRIDISKYNQEQLVSIAEQFQILKSCLEFLKKHKAICVFWDTNKPFFMAFQVKTDSDLFSENDYKGLKLWTNEYSFLTKSDRDQLLTIPATAINTKKQKPNNKNAEVIENPESSIDETQANNNSQADLNMDAILDKINKFGIDSLSKEERTFLDSFSK